MRSSKRIPFAVLWIASLACVVPGLALPDVNAISTSAAQTVIAGLTQNAPQASLWPTLTAATPSFTFTPEPPTFTATETSTPTQTLTPTLIPTATLSIPLISVSVPTNCRNGPGKVYVLQGALLVGETAQVYGRDPTNRYWYIRNPDSGSEFCWVWGEYATLTGPFMLLPVYTPPPTPTPTMTPTPSPSFTAEYSSLDSCVGWWVEIKLKNTGPLPFKSVEIKVKDKVTDIELVALSDGFTDLDGCLKTTIKDTLGPGDTFIISAPAFTYNPSGHNIRALITLCSNTGQKGACITRKINFKP
ncbi:MAG TPA: hypothetical protein VJL10_02725 [Anaerolineales bacterium]|nr:hypothetical protein [Anaerolineales bacterium]